MIIALTQCKENDFSADPGYGDIISAQTQGKGNYLAVDSG
jgi:hypothetical protein